MKCNNKKDLLFYSSDQKKKRRGGYLKPTDGSDESSLGWRGTGSSFSGAGAVGRGVPHYIGNLTHCSAPAT